MTTFIFANNINTTLAGAVSSGATTITLSSTQNLPSSIPAGQVLVITLNDVATRNNYEILYATAISGATLTVLRAQEGTAALSWLTGDFAFSGPTAGQQASFGELSASNTWTGANTFSNPVTVGAAVTTGEAVNLGQFPSSLSSNGYKKFPDSSSPSGYYIEQWGVFSGITSSQTLTLPIAFPNAFIQVNATDTGSNCYAYGSIPVSTSQFNLFISSTAPHTGTWIARGY